MCFRALRLGSSASGFNLGRATVRQTLGARGGSWSCCYSLVQVVVVPIRHLYHLKFLPVDATTYSSKSHVRLERVTRFQVWGLQVRTASLQEGLAEDL